MAHLTAHQQRKFMRENGFRHTNSNKRWDIWEDGYSRVLVSSRPSGDPHAWRNNERDVKKALKLRAEKEKEKEAMQPKQEPMEDREPRRTLISAPPTIGEPLTAKIGESIGVAPKKIPFPGVRVYNEDDRELMKMRIKELSDEKKNNQEIAEILESEGFKNAHGNAVSWSTVATFRKEMGLVKQYAPRSETKKIVVNGQVREEREPSDPKMISVKEAVERLKNTAPITPPKSITEIDAAPIEWEEEPTPSVALQPAPVALPPAPIVVQTRSDRVITDPMLQILKDPLLSDTKKVRMLLALLEDI